MGLLNPAATVVDLTGAIKYLIHWPLAAPYDAYRAGAKYSTLSGLIAGLIPGVPYMAVRLVLGPFIAAWKWYNSR